MIILDSYYPCSFSKITFKSIADSLSIKMSSMEHHSDISICFVDGDSANTHLVIMTIYELRQSKKNVYTITLFSKRENCSTVVKHFSDLVVEKIITYDELQRQVEYILSQKPKALADDVFGDIWGDLLKFSCREQQVLNMLLNGHSQNEIAEILNLSIKTISGYKIKAVKRHGARNFNELYISKQNNF
ncbi:MULTISPECIES: helix-turn-helix domain-containing protein [Enterobacteriaceae]|uniref:helix-turn-helix domain-containing protein n=1 Tax=Enterobacteriaceae TaxID=543 RepID=UPI001A2C917F|nr:MULTISPECIES: helix-turn-helix transcriptional regulator [Klebsiella]QUE99285.1 helix-turn-helix transcriptional regulator [Klebsiella pasteurii]GKO93678.1 hypothetical protein NUBL17186_46960 [Klebsiella quasipneumoniae]HAT3652286.1 helix-turn-helix transcriptional regulator [Raoultella ornithinolytica]HCI9061448.1 helix-turn-helix transcriptional regulator [Klebsiella quasipneumoniae]